MKNAVLKVNNLLYHAEVAPHAMPWIALRAVQEFPYAVVIVFHRRDRQTLLARKMVVNRRFRDTKPYG